MMKRIKGRPKPGYHVREIKRGVLGTTSKIREELDELEDAEEQGVKAMVIVELSDLIGAIESYLDHHYEDFTLQDLIKMHEVTKRAFVNGHRKSR